ncbi:pirin family protein [Novosphingobium terrae]|uniref:pirin family protein n=1 Tax=Novosphingobium terrae TaxID=2726189 RepID=UPI00197EE302|nr:pirin family protein [Novosphingobium terrae]
MLQHRPLSQIGAVDHGWLKARLHVAIGGQGHPAHHPIGNLVVFNDDEIAAGAGFPTHPHADMEIVTYVRAGVVTHEDSMGNKGQIKAGKVLAMSTGTGIRHSEYNAHQQPACLFQIWLWPRERGGVPQWGICSFPDAERSGAFMPLASGYQAPGAIAIRADAEVYGAFLTAGAATRFDIRPGHSGYLVPASGCVTVNGERIETRSGLLIRNENAVEVEALSDAEVILVVTAAVSPPL